MYYYDIHTHQPASRPEDIAIINRLVTGQEADLPPHSAACTQFFSVGIHPWYIDNVKEQLAELEALLTRPEVVAVGEAGLDKLAETPMDIQHELFLAQALLAEAINKPLLIHCVKAWPELIAAQKAVRPHIPWIIHGFRGNGELATQLIRQGFLLSFGERFNPAALQAARNTPFFAETDGKDTGIRQVYQQIATCLHTPIKEIASQLEQNVLNTFHIRNAHP